MPRRPRLEALEDRTAPTVTLFGSAVWTSQGPGPSTNGQVEGLAAQNNPVSGAIEAIAPHPTNPDIVYVGAANGGVWRSLNATASSPSWTALTDQMPSLSIGAIALSPADPNTIYAGTGAYSSGNDGEPGVGVLKTSDGGQTWTVQGQSVFAGRKIRSVVPTSLGGGQVVLAATFDPNNPFTNIDGLYRSTDGAVSWSRISGTGGLPNAAVSHVVSDPGNSNRFYAAVPGQGVFRSTDGGVTWAAVNTGLTGIGSSTRIELAVHQNQATGSNAVYAGVIGLVGQLTGLFRSGSQGASWTPMDTPSTTEGGTTYGIHPKAKPGSQGRIHFSIVADPVNPNVVYVGGDRQPVFGEPGVGFPNSIGCQDASGRHFRGDASQPSGSQWVPLNCGGANGTSPHADSRDLVFDANGNIIEADDGGLYRLLSPSSQASRRWASANGNIRPTEFYEVAYDPLNKTILGGTQDVGTLHQLARGNITWNTLDPTDRGDGGVVQVDALTIPGSTIHYSSYVNLQFFRRRTFNANSQVTATTFVQLNLGGVSLLVVDNTLQFIQPYVLNAITPTRMLIGSNFLYESFDQGDTLTRRVGGQNIGTVAAMAYGGRSGGVANPEVTWVGTGIDTTFDQFPDSNPRLFLRTTAGDTFSQVTTYPGSVPFDIVMDPDDWRTTYVVDRTNIYQTKDGGATWTRITGDLGQLSTDLRAIELFPRTPNTGDEAVLVGGVGGVYRTQNPNAGATTAWTRFGTGLPNALVTDLDYDSGDDVLLAGTFGRSAFTTNSGSGQIIVQVDGDTNFANQNDNITLVRDRTDPTKLNIFVNTDPVFQVDLQSVHLINVRGLGGNDTITIDPSNGPISSQIHIDGGDGGDTYVVTLSGSTAAASVTIADAGLSGSDTVLINGTDSADAVHLTPAQVSSGTEVISFGGIESLSIDTKRNNDTIFVEGTPVGVPVAINGGDDDDAILVDSNGAAPGGTAALIQSIVTMEGGTGLNSISLENGSAPNSVIVSVTPSQIGAAPGDSFFGAGGSVSYNRFDVVALNLSNSNTGDRVNLTPSFATRFSINGNNPQPPTVNGDVLNLDTAGTVNPLLTLTGPGTGQWTFGNRRPVSFTSMETLTPVATISGQKSNDLNGNGVKNAGEPGLSGWTIFLDTNGNGSLDAGETSTSTDSAGNFSFTNLTSGTYRVREVVQNGWMQTTSNPADLIVTGSSTQSGVDFGNFQLVSISGQKYEDANGNRAREAGERGLPGWTIFLDANNNGTLDSGEIRAVTDATGSYNFTNLGPATYRVREVVQSGWTQLTSNPADILAISGLNVSGVDFGNFQLISITGQKFQDSNGNGQKDSGESGLPGWTIFIDANSNGTFDTGDPSAVTDANGNYSFNLGPGTYRVREVLQAGWLQTTINPSDLLAVSGRNAVGVDFGNFKRITINGQVFEDTNGNGQKEAGEPALQGWTVFLDNNGSGVPDSGEPSIVTGASGAYSFANLGPGTYRLREVVQAGWTLTASLPTTIAAASGQDLTLNLGNFRRIAISGQKYRDLNGNGARETGEPGLAGWTIFLDGNDNGVLDTGEASTVTDAGGNYLFANLGAGAYRVREVIQAGWLQTSPVPAAITVSSGVSISALDIGNFQLIAIRGTKFQDSNGNGLRDVGDFGLQGWTLFLDGNQNGSLDSGEATAVTDAAGAYRFLVGPGPYRIREVVQAGWVQTTVNPVDILAVSGADVSGMDFGNFQLITVSGQKFNDLNGNGFKNANELGLSGWTIFLDANNNGLLDIGEASTTTPGTGNYTFVLGPGVHRLREVVQAGWLQTTIDPADISAISGLVLTGEDFGNFQRVTISGQKFRDTNGNGLKEAGEPGLADWTIFIDANGNNVLDGNEASALTDSNGNYSFIVGPGTYRIREEVRSGWLPTTAAPNPLGVSSGTNVGGVDFGNFQTISIAGQKFHDANGNGLFDPGETGLSGWTIFLDGDNDGVFDTGEPSRLTPPSGSFTFTDLGPGTYRVRETPQANWQQTTPVLADIVASSGAAVTGQNLGNFQRSPLSGKVFDDANGNGLQETGELGLQGWTIFLDDNNNGTLETGETATTSDASGKYTFGNLGPGTYHPRQVQQTSWVRTTANVDVVAVSAQPATVNFGNFKLITIRGTKFHDVNGNGRKDPGESGLSGWTIFLDSNRNAQLDAGETSTASDAGGNYAFTNLGPGLYRVREVLQPGWVRVTGNPDVAALSGTDETGKDFGNFQLITLGGRNFDDLNGNGQLDAGEPGLVGWTIFLDANDNGTLDSGESSSLSDGSGSYSFILGPGSYRVRELGQAGWVQTSGSPPLQATASGQNLSGLNFGNFRLISISGSKFHDLNGNGARDAGEGGLAGWSIFVDKNGNGVFDPTEPTALTDAGGNYILANLGPGSHRTAEVLQLGWAQTLAPNPATILAVSGTNVVGVSFGNSQVVGISGRVFDDLDTNGNDNGGAEPGTNGYVIELYRDVNANGRLDLGVDTPVASTVTATDSGSAGRYRFGAVLPGTYVLREVKQTGHIQTLPTAPGTYAFVVQSGVAVGNRDFGNINDANRSYVYQVYQDLLGRRVEQLGLTYWTDLLSRGAPRTQVALGVQSSQEYRARLVNTLYVSYLARPADPFGLSFSLGLLLSTPLPAVAGSSTQLVRINLLGSDEYFQNRGGNNNSGFLSALYHDTLGRELDTVGQAVFGGMLAGGVSRDRVVREVLDSVEGQRVLVDSFYQRFLNRRADDFGLNIFVNLLRQGLGEEEVLARIVGSDEYFARL